MEICFRKNGKSFVQCLHNDELFMTTNVVGQFKNVTYCQNRFVNHLQTVGKCRDLTDIKNPCFHKTQFIEHIIQVISTKLFIVLLVWFICYVASAMLTRQPEMQIFADNEHDDEG